MTATDIDPEEFQRLTGVSRETMDRLVIYADLLVRWQPAINLIGPATIGQIWRRHFLDSAQLARYIDKGTTLLDIGSGAGFPGLVLAIMGIARVDLVERDARKCVFLAEVARLTSAPVEIHRKDARHVKRGQVDVITARGCAPLGALLEISKPFIADTTYCVFPKGKAYEEELTIASKSWNMNVETFKSVTDPSGVILRLRNIVYSRKNGPRI